MAAKTDFAIIPTQEELDEIDRELRFFSVQNEHPNALTTEQIGQYNRLGYVKGIRIFSPSHIAEIRAVFDRLLAEALAAGKDSYSISSAHLKHPLAYDLLTNSEIVSYVKDLLGPNVVGPPRRAHQHGTQRGAGGGAERDIARRRRTGARGAGAGAPVVSLLGHIHA